MPDAYMGVRIIEGPNTTDDESVAKRADVPGEEKSKCVKENIQMISMRKE